MDSSQVNIFHLFPQCHLIKCSYQTTGEFKNIYSTAAVYTAKSRPGKSFLGILTPSNFSEPSFNMNRMKDNSINKETNCFKHSRPHPQNPENEYIKISREKFIHMLLLPRNCKNKIRNHTFLKIMNFQCKN